MGQNKKHCTKNGTLKQERNNREVYQVVFYRSASGREPVRQWLKQLDPVNRKRIGEALYTLQLGWPLGMPLARKIETNLRELKSKIVDGITRIMITEKKGRLILLHGFIKKSQKLSAAELKLARKRLFVVGMVEKYEQRKPTYW
jgi:phage-related protein